MCSGTAPLIDIRALRADDREPIRMLLEETGVFTGDEIAVAIELIDIVLHVSGQRDYTIYTAVDDHHEVAGFYCIGSTPLTESTYDLYWIAVKPSVHKSGIGKQLLHHAEESVRSQGGRLVVAETSSQPKYDATRKFYLRNAYQEVARIKDYYKTGDDLVIYGKYFSQ
ncbi:MAG: GNAT family N-acetyltransferase [Ignavibacteriae bacterium]|nr:GNAT family N-acetyltransferase [Ignavibacteria bacterium]MBI3363629.1 GNAT family N-acetyltransferase [Ignavibacteriota bacterium]